MSQTSSSENAFETEVFPPSNFMYRVLRDIRASGNPVETRLGGAVELTNIDATWRAGNFYTRPGMNQWIGWTELFQLLAGTFHPETFKHVAPNAQLELFTANMAYGPRIAEQWARVLQELSISPDSRRAVMYVGQHDEAIYTRPCTISIQFLIRSGVLETIVSMRSWDIFKGMPYDIMMFSGIALVTARILGVEPGWVSVNAASAHVYDSDISRIDENEEHWKMYRITLDDRAPTSHEKMVAWANGLDFFLSRMPKNERMGLLESRGISVDLVY